MLWLVNKYELSRRTWMHQETNVIFQDTFRCDICQVVCCIHTNIAYSTFKLWLIEITLEVLANLYKQVMLSLGGTLTNNVNDLVTCTSKSEWIMISTFECVRENIWRRSALRYIHSMLFLYLCLAETWLVTVEWQSQQCCIQWWWLKNRLMFGGSGCPSPQGSVSQISPPSSWPLTFPWT